MTHTPELPLLAEQARSDPFGLIRLDDEECWRFLRHHSIGRVAVVHLQMPVIFPVNYAVDGHTIVFRSGPGTKLAMAANGRNAVFEVDDAFDVLETGTSVMVHGVLEEITSPADKERAEALPLHCWAPGNRDHLIRVRSAYVTGRRIAPHEMIDGVTADGG